MNVFKSIVLFAINFIPILTTTNYKGKSPPGAFQSAYTVTQYNYVVKGAGSDIKIDVECWMLQDSSWLNWRLPQLNDTGVLSHLLIHEQGHFNITILFAKRLKQECGKVDASHPDAETPRLLKIKERLDYESSAMNDKYENETRNGRDIVEQGKWNKLISAELSKLDGLNVRIYFK
jgi:hypothetical protein